MTAVIKVEPEAITHMPALKQAGSYLLHFWLGYPLRQIVVGRLGCFDLAVGHYYYVGSAIGAGGLAARLRRHVTIEKRRHWHIDYLRPYFDLHTIWVAIDPERRECRWCRALAAQAMLSRPIPGFGASDTGCGGHLFYAVTVLTTIAEILEQA
ncbi:MAG: GIY-YIG nuclease family protein [Chloroflexus sp.]